MFTQSYNRYSYCLNNPLKYTDPSGYSYKPDDWDKANSVSNPWFNAGRTGSIGPGSGNHWSDTKRNEYFNYMLSSTSAFNNIYGSGASEIAKNIASHSTSLSDWRQGTISIASVREKGGFWIQYDAGTVGGTASELSINNPNDISGVDIGSKFINIANYGKDGNNWLDKTLNYFSKLDGAAAAATRAREKLELEYLRQVDINRVLSANYSQTVKHSMIAIKAVGKFTGVASMGISWADYANNRTTGNLIQAIANTGLVGVRVNPITGIIIGVADVTGASDYVYDQIGGLIEHC